MFLYYYYIFAVLIAFPVTVIFKKAGFPRWWALLLFVPDFGLILCAAVLAAKKWPPVTAGDAT